MEIILVVIAVLLVLLFIGGYVATRRRNEHWSEHVADAERALEQAWAADRGWDPEILHRSAREALGSHRPGWEYKDVHLVVVDDKPGVEQDTAHLVAVGDEGEARVVLAREPDGGWRVDSVD
ncbi:MAG TPA: hypothetical protein VD790_04680 [Thermoleophilaceae bacterium]|nr:hypothetical protein [Thermoleophilaceae bacterium]